MANCKAVVHDSSAEDMQTMENCKGKAVVQDSSIPSAQDIHKSKFFLHIDCIKTRNLEGQSYGYALLTDTVIPCYYVSVTLEENLVDGQHWSKDTQPRCKSIEKNHLIWNCTDIWFKLDLMKIHVSDLKLEVIQHYDIEGLRRDEVGTSNGTRVVGRARIPLWKFIQGDDQKNQNTRDKLEELKRGGAEKRSKCVQLAKTNGCAEPKAEGDDDEKKHKLDTLEELLGGDAKRSKRIQLTKMEGAAPIPQGFLQVDMIVKKVTGRNRKRKRKRNGKQAGLPMVTLRQKMMRK